MTIDVEHLLAWPFQDVVHHYTARDSMFYALSIGLGADPLDRRQLRYVYENGLQAFPTMALVLGHPGPWLRHSDSGIDANMVVFGEHTLTLHQPLPEAATVVAREQVVGVVDKGEGRGALLYVQRRITDQGSGDALATLEATFFCRANGGFGGPSGSLRPIVTLPGTPPDTVVTMPTLPQAALLYRLNVDYNPLHADPDAAAAVGFPRPILHGLCTYAVAAHAVVRTFCGYDGAQLQSISARFSAPVYPGEAVDVELWQRGNDVYFRGWVRAREAKVLDGGKAILRS